jgi:tetratricopeptide (TPR) repeat protein
MRPFVSVLFLASVTVAAPAAAQIHVVGRSPAAICFEHAVASRTDRRALQDCDEALESPVLLRRDRAATHVNRGIILMYRGESDNALAAYDAADAMGVQDRSSLALNRSSALIRLDRYADAIAQADLVIAANDRHVAEAWLNRGIAHEAQGDLHAAYEAYMEALNARPDWHLAQRQVARFTVTPAS